MEPREGGGTRFCRMTDGAVGVPTRTADAGTAY